MNGTLGNHFRFAKVEPPSVNALFGTCLIEIPVPIDGGRIHEVDDAHLVVAHPCHVRTFRVGKQPSIEQRQVVCRFFSKVWLGDDDGVYALLLEVCHHLSRIRPFRLVPVEVAHAILFLAFPEEVEHNTADRHLCLFERSDNTFCLLL